MFGTVGTDVEFCHVKPSEDVIIVVVELLPKLEELTAQNSVRSGDQHTEDHELLDISLRIV